MSTKKRIQGIFLDSEELGFFEAILIAQGMNVIFISSCVTGAFLGAAFALKFRPTSKSEIIVELSDKVEALENKLNEKT
ncbi:hypothetical protein [Coraliomargarita parva]|uniref:hypothetical protein n=1 Tax=Coraliomargarita parva TaxID=3014050 RepID=UPI0022B50433|nr:hypothetical protein [Coraliomargarita parva]